MGTAVAKVWRLEGTCDPSTNEETDQLKERLLAKGATKALGIPEICS